MLCLVEAKGLVNNNMNHAYGKVPFIKILNSLCTHTDKQSKVEKEFTGYSFILQ